MAVTLWDHPLSPYAQKVKIALREKGVAYETAVPGGIGVGGAAGDFVTANPRAEVPALIHDGFGIFDSTIILEYIEDAWPEPSLLPASPVDRARVRMIEEVVDTHLEAVNWGLSELRWFRRAEGPLGEELSARAGGQVRGYFAWLERELGDREWFNGDGFGWGDLSVVPYVNGSVGHGIAPEPGSRLAAWLARANDRPSVRETVAEAAAVASTGGMGDVAKLLEQGLFKREYRDHRLEWMVKSGGLEVVSQGMARGNIRFTPDLA
ncbi:glutathione S-transferase/RNA polymerase-associated protein [Sphingomonas sp. OV641]|uniref:glutathione S-transferase family protein n=1 Tax=Sphingomonas sp. OV641 TaxID=1881068 RepID=UPI0008BF1756|nr:glutathione S-transferase family protein [Sphingomonas sp. OV641]SEJ67426.1 glutathione S-transferase/RNA polymerase-associated protein [Sphingomonas sp. OV641]